MELNPDPATPPKTFRFVTWIDDRLTRLGVVGVFARDSALAVCIAVTALAILTVMLVFVPSLEDVHFGAPAVVALAVVVCAQSALLCLRRTRPVLCLLLAAACQILFLALLPIGGTFRGLATLVAAYTVGTLLPTRSIVTVSLVAVGIETVGGAVAVLVRPAVATLTATSLDASPVSGPAALILINCLAAAFAYAALSLIGSHVAIRRRHLRLVRTRAAEAIEAQRAKAAAAVDAERSRLARELHDIAAHHLSGMVVQAAAVERLIDRDRAAAKEGTAWIRSQGKETLKNLRLVVGVLRERHDGPGRHGELGEDSAPVPGLAVLDSLVATARQLGNPVTVERRGRSRELPPIADVTLYRVAQEALSNVRQYAPGASVRLSLGFDANRVSLGVDNDPAGNRQPDPGARQGMGLIGMRERVQLVGGTLTYGPAPHGGWRVSVSVPDMVPETKTARPSGAATTMENGGPR